MVVRCPLCEYSTGAIVWFKFLDKPWIPWKPKVFPIAIVTTPSTNGEVEAKLYTRPVSQPRPYKPFFSYINQATGTQSHGLATIQSNVYFYGDGTDPPTTVLKDVSNNVFRWFARGKDACGNDIDYILSSTTGGFQFSPQQTSGVIRTNNLNFEYQNLANVQWSCGACPSGWDRVFYQVKGQGEPEVVVHCDGIYCPPNTTCSCTKDGKTCCFDALGNPIYSF